MTAHSSVQLISATDCITLLWSHNGPDQCKMLLSLKKIAADRYCHIFHSWVMCSHVKI